MTVKNDVDGLLIDIDGTISFGGAPLPGAVIDSIAELPRLLGLE